MKKMLGISLVPLALMAQITVSCNPPVNPAPVGSTGTASERVTWKQLSYQLSWHAGDKDVNGDTMYGTEIMRILPYKGKLYASTSMWMESSLAIPKACQLLVLDSPGGKWKISHQFPSKNLRLVCLQTVTFGTDSAGKRITPVEILLAAPDTVGVGDVQVFSLDDRTGNLVAMSLGISTATYSSTRAIGTHRDRMTGVDLVFAGNDVLGIFNGTFDAATPGRIKWQRSPEMVVPPGERVMSFTESNGTIYVATSRHIFRRIDGTIPAWEQVYECLQETNATGIRGLTSVPNPSGKGEVLLFGALSTIRHIDPLDNYKETIELDMRGYLSNLWSTVVTYVLPAYNDFLPWTIPATGEKVYLFGFESAYAAYEVNSHPEWRVFKTPGAGTYAAEARYFIRHTKGGNISFEVSEVTDTALPTLVSVRTIAVSPFAADKGRVLYFGGFDCNSQPSHNTGWIYSGGY